MSVRSCVGFVARTGSSTEEREILKKAAAFSSGKARPGERVRFIAAEKASYSVTIMCRVLEVSSAGFTPGRTAARASALRTRG